ncbi:hypothetical protein QQS21_005382 [Conoideocrella luteorostrata]|uniref:Uncharacterized protein n=1 Tax=Conoideocrella luteorostrata TaxID=1105319 RepID=A0AAJ0FZ14_9HYPO|nr:hypothetical protein QQS21_005382 [Conoideocrella luteorostrata]
MKLLSAYKSLLLTAAAVSLSLLASGTPIVRITDVAESQAIAHSRGLSAVPVELEDDASIIPQDEDGLFLRSVANEDAKHVFVRVNFPRPPTPPPLPEPAPRLVPHTDPRPNNPPGRNQPVPPPGTGREPPPKPDPAAKPIPPTEHPG